MKKPKYKKGDRIKMSEDALENYGEAWRDKVLIVTHVATKSGRWDEEGAHPGFDESAGSALYDFDIEGADKLNFSLYEWEMKRA